MKDALAATLGAEAVKPAARWKLCASAYAAAGTQISARYHSNGGVREGDW